MIIVTLTDFVDSSGLLVYAIEEIDNPMKGGDDNNEQNRYYRVSH